ncbi:MULTISPECIES: LysR family transcriptional regulator [Bacillus]|uniref:LysR family transcriptional regulator n=1 Tax=Bacillus TaxID=1386 RepID=UPI000C776606|nr:MULTISPECIES: LysR family transcriptional regulator [Bacillus]PLR87029.1 LysR family transcriptional regulator [Bacillus sp. V33-4]RSK57897.1 LysR family transcriptional regulator [Bacillus canaveralius]
MEIKQLITFKIAGETLNFTQTAKMLNFAQSSVTAQIKALEAELGTPLFERLGKRLILTEAGREFKLYADKMIMLAKEAKLAVNGEEKTAGTLTIGAQESQCTYRLPPILKEFKAQLPKVKLIFKPAHSDEMVRQQLLEGKLDIAFIMDKPKPGDFLTVEPLIQEQLIMVAAPDHSLLAKAEVYAKDLEHETLLLTETGCSYRTILEENFRSAGVFPLTKFEFVSIEAIKQCVIAGLGIALLPAMAVEADLKMGRLEKLAWKTSTAPIFTQIAWHKDKWITPPISAFVELTRKTFNTYQNA